MKNNITITIILIISFLSLQFVLNTYLKYLPKPEVSGGLRGELGIDKNINEKNIDKYLNRTDSVYYDMRMLKDEAQYENVGGDSYLSGFVKGFEIIPYPYLAPTYDLPEEVGSPYSGETLFDITVDKKYVPKYKESLNILEGLFPKDKNVFLMCGGGGYAKMTKDMLIALGWNENKIYNVGGYWYYHGKNDVKVKDDSLNYINYDFWKVPYHNIDFNLLHEVK